MGLCPPGELARTDTTATVPRRLTWRGLGITALLSRHDEMEITDSMAAGLNLGRVFLTGCTFCPVDFSTVLGLDGVVHVGSVCSGAKATSPSASPTSIGWYDASRGSPSLSLVATTARLSASSWRVT